MKKGACSTLHRNAKRPVQSDIHSCTKVWAGDACADWHHHHHHHSSTKRRKKEKNKKISSSSSSGSLSLSLSGISSGCGYLSTRGRRFHRHDEQHRQQRAHTRGGPGYSRASSSRRLSVGWTPQSATHRSSRHKIQWKKTTFLYPAVCDRHPTCFVNCLSLRARW